MSVPAFLILNETTFIGTNQVTTEPVSLHETLTGAVEWLAELASDNDVLIDEDANSVYLPPQIGMESDEYYIVEMELKD